VVTTLNNGVPTIASTDGRFTANFHGILQFDAGGYDQSQLGPISTDLRRSGPALGASASNVDLTHARDLKDGDNFRRARIGVDGRAFGDWDYKLIFDFAGSGTEDAGQLYEGWIQYSGLKPVHLRVGAFSPSIGMEDQAPTNGMPLLERSAVEDIARGFVAGDTRTAVELWGAGDHWLASAALTGRVIGVLNTGTATAVAQSYGDQLGVVGRLAGTPFHGADWLVHVGVHGSYLIDPPNLTGPTPAGLLAAPNAEVVAFSLQYAGAPYRRHQADQHRQYPGQSRLDHRPGIRRSEAELPVPDRVRVFHGQPDGRSLDAHLQRLLFRGRLGDHRRTACL
jgi:phosphate-selective porin OprO/OprP